MLKYEYNTNHGVIIMYENNNNEENVLEKYGSNIIEDVKKGKIDSYVKSGRLIPVCNDTFL